MEIDSFGAIFDRLQIYRIKHLPAPTPQGRAEQIGTAGMVKNNLIQNNILSSLSSSVESILSLNRAARSMMKSLKISVGILDLT